MHDTEKTKVQLLAEVAALRQRVAALEAAAPPPGVEAGDQRDPRLTAVEDTTAQQHASAHGRVADALQRQTALLQRLQQVAAAANEAATPAEAMQTCLDFVCAYTGWPIGHVYVCTDEPPYHLVSTGIWHHDQRVGFAAFRQATEATTFDPQQGLAGRILARGQPLWILDVEHDPLFLRRREAAAMGLRSAYGFPVLVGAAVGAVLEFFTADGPPPDAEMLDTVGHMGTQLGRVIERQRAAAALQEREAYLRAIVELAVDGIVLIDERGMVQMCNPAVERLFGYTADEVIGHNVSLLMPAPDRDAHDAYIERYLRTGERRIIGIGRDVLGQRKDGTPIPLRLSVSEIPLGNQRFFLGILHDITVLKQTETALRQARDDLEQRVRERTAALQAANDEIRRFAYIVSHDLRAPLINLHGFAGELRDACSALTAVLPDAVPHLEARQAATLTQVLEADIPEALGFIETSVGRMDRLIEAVLQLSRLGRQELRLEPVATEALVAETLRTLAHQIAQRQVQVTVGPLPVVHADRLALAQIFGNLLANAVAYLEPDRPGAITITAEQRPGVTVFAVQDNGRGIAAGDIPHIFEPFRRAGRQDVPGEGMGLAYVRTLVRRHGGEITCQSTLGVGTTFAFTVAHALSQGDSYA